MYLRRIVISKEHLHSYIWDVRPLFQEATCSDAVIFMKQALPVIRFFRYWDNLSLSVIAYNSMNGAFCCIRGVAVTHSSIFTVFFQTKSYSEERYDSQQLWYLLGCRDVNIEWCFVIWRHQLQPFIFSIVLPLFHGSIYVKASVSISRLLLQLSILKNGLWLTIHYKKWSVIDHLL